MTTPASRPPQPRTALAPGNPGQDCSSDELVAAWMCVARGYTHITQTLTEQVEQETGLSPAGFFALVRLLRDGGQAVPLSALARQVAFSSGGFTKVADRLEQAGLIERQPSACDRRVTNAVLTPAGRMLAERAFAVYSARLRELVIERLGITELRVLADHMSRLSGDTVPGNSVAAEAGLEHAPRSVR
jgi:DNA-binding MarR family transcriptional regulator